MIRSALGASVVGLGLFLLRISAGFIDIGTEVRSVYSYNLTHLHDSGEESSPDSLLESVFDGGVRLV